MTATQKDKMTRTWRERLREFYPRAFEFSHLAIAEERPSALWLFLLPMAYIRKTKCYIAGYRSRDNTLCLFRFRRSMFSAFAGFTDMEEIPLDDVKDLRFKSHLLTASLRFKDADGRRRKYVFALPSRRNSKAMLADMR